MITVFPEIFCSCVQRGNTSWEDDAAGDTINIHKEAENNPINALVLI